MLYSKDPDIGLNVCILKNAIFDCLPFYPVLASYQCEKDKVAKKKCKTEIYFRIDYTIDRALCVTNIEVCSQDDLSNDIETLLEEVKIVQANLSDLPDESLDAMEAGLRVSAI